MINKPTVAVEMKVWEDDVNRRCPASNFHRLEAGGIWQFNRRSHATA